MKMTTCFLREGLGRWEIIFVNLADFVCQAKCSLGATKKQMHVFMD
jgi:hypothetical protein